MGSFRFTFAAFLLFVCFATAATAGMYKCVDPRTKAVTYSGTPCIAGNQQELSITENAIMDGAAAQREIAKQQSQQGSGSQTQNFNTQVCYESSILVPSPFMGNNDEILKLADGSVWQVKYQYEYLYEYNPSVIICPSRGKLIVGKKSLNVQLVSGPQKVAGSPTGRYTQAGKWDLFEETNLQGSISGTVQQGQIFKTTSGNVYEVTGLTLQLVLELQPDVMVFRNGQTYKLIVKGFDEPLICRKLN